MTTPVPSWARGGTGLSFALYLRLVEICGGRIWVESAGHHNGAAFLPEIPGFAE